MVLASLALISALSLHSHRFRDTVCLCDPGILRGIIEDFNMSQFPFIIDYDASLYKRKTNIKPTLAARGRSFNDLKICFVG